MWTQNIFVVTISPGTIEDDGISRSERRGKELVEVSLLYNVRWYLDSLSGESRYSYTGDT